MRVSALEDRMVRRGRVVFSAMRAEARPPSPCVNRAERIGTDRETRPPFLASVCVILSVATITPPGAHGNTLARNKRSPMSSSIPAM